MGKGHVLGIESFLVMVGWLLILLAVWSLSSQHVHSLSNEWKSSLALHASVVESDALIFSHHSNPWLGCAYFDAPTQRVFSYVVRESCLLSLSHTSPPSPFVARVSMHTFTNDKTYFFRAVDENAVCMSVRRPIRLHERSIIVWLEVLSCV
ncbi:MAG: hypothetical protein FJY86_03105 [Candidatus Diapherotrites archaeon]|uniref:Uncharacterized protein n=1 Tax=Candidatus Iainarchaeum sp. TaxID=3101447 RepID=A0A8T4C6V7_9ARCH|nr:hypothetical protein [Candidatus Diapherotrites archaeon]